MSFLLYLIGFLLIMAGVAWALFLIGVTFIKIAIVCLILAGLAMITGVVHTRPKDPHS